MIYGLIVGTIIACEIALILPFVKTVKVLLSTYGKIGKTMRSSRISDHWKERVLVVYAGRSMKASIMVLVFMALLLLPFFAIGFAISQDLEATIVALSDLVHMVLITFVAIAYIKVRLKFKNG